MYSSSLYCFFIIFSLRSNFRARSLRQSAKRASLGSWIVVCHILGAICFLVIIIIIFLLFCKFWAKVRNYYEIRITNEGNCIIFLFCAKKSSKFFYHRKSSKKHHNYIDNKVFSSLIIAIC